MSARGREASGGDPDVFVRIRACGVLPVATLEHAGDAPRVGAALRAGGLDCLEITFRTPAGMSAIAAVREHEPNLLVGAGTVLDVQQARDAVDAGAGFVVSPGFSDDVVDWCLAHGVPVLPGVMTPTEVIQALRRGVRWLKFFPAETAGGPQALAALTAVFSDVTWVPTGGIGPANLADYLALPSVAACGGSWMIDRDALEAGDLTGITRRAESAVETVRVARVAE